MTKEERKEYMRKYRKEHKEQIAAAVDRQNAKKAIAALDHMETIPGGMRACLKDGRTFDFIRPFR